MFAGIAIAVALLAVVFAVAYSAGKRRGRKPPAAAADDPTGYVPGVWLLGGGESPSGHKHPHGHHGHAHEGGHGGGHAHDASGHAGGGDAGSDGGGSDGTA
jgi:hypothetical protein